MLVIGINTIPKFKITETVRNRIMYMMPGSYALLYVQQKNPIGSNYFVASTSSVTSTCTGTSTLCYAANQYWLAA